MYALFLEVNADESRIEQARRILPGQAVPMAKEVGDNSGSWLAPLDGKGVSVVLFDDEEAARSAAANFTPGQPVGPVEGVTVSRVAVREVLASF